MYFGVFSCLFNFSLLDFADLCAFLPVCIIDLYLFGSPLTMFLEWSYMLVDEIHLIVSTERFFLSLSVCEGVNVLGTFMEDLSASVLLAPFMRLPGLKFFVDRLNFYLVSRTDLSDTFSSLALFLALANISTLTQRFLLSSWISFMPSLISSTLTSSGRFVPRIKRPPSLALTCGFL